jgi:hypothetical protein
VGRWYAAYLDQHVGAPRWSAREGTIEMVNQALAPSQADPSTPRKGPAMTSGTIERKCMKRHNKAEGRCSPRCVRWYPRIQRARPDGHGRRKFDYLGGYPTKAAARSALDQALGRHGDTVAPDGSSSTGAGVGGPAPPTLNDLLDRWLAHLHTNKPSGCAPSAATANSLSTTSAPTSAPSPSARSGPSTSNSCTTS